ncbi:Uncharacterised protein [Mycobacterium tuberculosis]|nr:Uncharacterised protein [Mycobacterium tuberculosis]
MMNQNMAGTILPIIGGPIVVKLIFWNTLARIKTKYMDRYTVGIITLGLGINGLVKLM